MHLVVVFASLLVLLAPLPVVKHFLSPTIDRTHSTVVTEESQPQFGWVNFSYGDSLTGVCWQQGQQWSAHCRQQLLHHQNPSGNRGPQSTVQCHMMQPESQPLHASLSCNDCSSLWACDTCARVQRERTCAADYSSRLWRLQQSSLTNEHAESTTPAIATARDSQSTAKAVAQATAASAREGAQQSQPEPSIKAAAADSSGSPAVAEQTVSGTHNLHILSSTGGVLRQECSPGMECSATQPALEGTPPGEQAPGPPASTTAGSMHASMKAAAIAVGSSSSRPAEAAVGRGAAEVIGSSEEPAEAVERSSSDDSTATEAPAAEDSGVKVARVELASGTAAPNGRGTDAAVLLLPASTDRSGTAATERAAVLPAIQTTGLSTTAAGVQQAEAGVCLIPAWVLDSRLHAVLNSTDIEQQQQQQRPPWATQPQVCAVAAGLAALMQEGEQGDLCLQTADAQAAAGPGVGPAQSEPRQQEVMGAQTAPPMWPPGVYLTLDMAQAINECGLLCLVAVLAVACACYSTVSWMAEFVADKAPASLLPLSVRKDPKKLDAYFALRQMANQQLMWFRLLGVSGAAVAVADRAQRRCQAVTSKANGAARFARKYVRGAVQRLQQEKQQALQHQKEQLEQQAAVQLQEQAGVHAAAIAAAEVQHQERQAALLKDVAALQQAREEDQLLINDLKVRERELAADARSKADVIAEQRATASSLHQQLVEVKSEKAGLSHELREVRDQLAREKGRVEAMLHEEQEVKGQAQTVNTKYESLQQQLSEMRSSNAQLTSEVAHLQAVNAAAEAGIAELRREKHSLEEKREQLQQQLTHSNGQLSEVRSQSAEYASKLQQLQERSTVQQEQLVTLQSSHSDLSSQLQQLQGVYAAAQTTISQLQAMLTASDTQLADGKAIIAELQTQLKQEEQQATGLRQQLAEANSSKLQLCSDLQHLQATHAAAEASIAELRSEKAAFAAKADDLQQRLTSTAAEVAELRSQHATTVAQLQQQQEANHSVQEQLEAAKAKNKRQSAEAASLQQLLQGVQQQLAHAEAAVEQLTSGKQHLQHEVAEHLAQIAVLEGRVQQLTVSLKQEQVAAADMQAHCEDLDQSLVESMQLLEDRENELQQLQEQKAELEGRVMALKANLDAKTATLREAQLSLSDTEGKLHEEYEKNFEMGRENNYLQADVDRLSQENEQMEQDLEEALADRATLLEQFEQLEASFKELLLQADEMHAKTEGLLTENLDTRVELAGKLTAAQAGLAAVTQERDDLAKKLYWAEIARDQHQSAKALAAADAIAARQALTEEKLLRRQVNSPGPASGGSRDAGAAGDTKEGGTPEGTRLLLRNNSSSSTGKWPAVKTGYLQQTIADRQGRTSSSSHGGIHSPCSPVASAASAGGASSMSLLGPGGSRSSSAPCTPRSAVGGDEDASSEVSSSSPFVQAQQQLQQEPEKPGSSYSSAAVDGVAVSPGGSSMCNTGSPITNVLRKSASLPALKTAAQELPTLHEQQLQPAVPRTAPGPAPQHQEPAEQLSSNSKQQQQGQQQQDGCDLAAAAEGLRRNFSDGGDLSPSSMPAAAAAASPTGSPARRGAADPQPGSPQQAPPLEASQSPSIRSSASRARSDRHALPLALSPVPFDLTASSDMGTVGITASSLGSIISAPASTSSADAAGSRGSATSACSSKSSLPTSRHDDRQQQPLSPVTPPAVRQPHAAAGAAAGSSQEVFFTPLPQTSGTEGVWSSCGSSASAAAAAAGGGATAGSGDSPLHGQGTPYYTPRGQPGAAEAAASVVGGGAGGGASEVSSPARSVCSARSFCSNSELDDEADVLIGSMSEADFASMGVHREASPSVAPVAPDAVSSEVSAAGGKNARRHRWSQQQQQQSILATEAMAAAAAAAARRSGTSPPLQPALAAAAQQKLSKNQKKRLRLKQKKQAALQQQPSLDVVHSTEGVFTSLETSCESLAAAAAAGGLAPQLSTGASQDGSLVECQGGLDDSAQNSSCSLVLAAEDSREDVPGTGDLADSPPKSMLMAVSAAAAAASSGSSAGTSGRYSSSPLLIRSALAAGANSPQPCSASTSAGPLQQPQLLPQMQRQQSPRQHHLLSQMSSGSLADDGAAAAADVSLASVGSAGSLASFGGGTQVAAAGPPGSSRLRSAAGRLGSPTRTSCSSIKNLVAQSRLRDAAEPGSSSSGGSSSRLMGSPQRFRTKFGVSPSHSSADAAVVADAAGLAASASSEALSPLGTGWSKRSGSSDQGAAAQVGSDALGAGEQLRDGPDIVVLRGSAELAMYRSSIQWKALSDSLSASAERLPGRLSRTGSGCSSGTGRLVAAAASLAPAAIAAVDAARSQEWKVAENMLYFE